MDTAFVQPTRAVSSSISIAKPTFLYEVPVSAATQFSGSPLLLKPVALAVICALGYKRQKQCHAKTSVHKATCKVAATATGTPPSPPPIPRGSPDEMKLTTSSSSPLQAPLEEMRNMIEGFVDFIRPFSKKRQGLENQDMVKVRDMVDGMERYALIAEARANKAEDENKALVLEKRSMQIQLEKARKQIELLSRYAEEVEIERDDLRDKIQAEQSRKSKQAQQLAALSQQLGALAAVTAMDPDSPTTSAQVVEAEEVAVEVPKPGDMTLEELQAECRVRGLDVDGSLAAVRGRVRAARAQDMRAN
eukprot:TRINITY_DN53839_c0_g1_i1.p1 TRINITY_DN53839_c0_g1~~TRINITY_DN53839_c0_g1_i1.p1  ORF type:complete len:305 (-),score=82.59 TRINITY_DN53839_c0_g1_i1:71-985(-)